jgi:hypothetical protein
VSLEAELWVLPWERERSSQLLVVLLSVRLRMLMGLVAQLSEIVQTLGPGEHLQLLLEKVVL